MGRNSIRAAAAIVAPVVALPLMLASQAASASVRTEALTCSASVSNAHPSDFTTVYVHVRTAGHAMVRTVAHFKTVNSSRHHEANASGRTTLSYNIGNAAPGYEVHVSVTVTSGSQKGSCSTAFTPQA
jgi:hypothetical protein